MVCHVAVRPQSGDDYTRFPGNTVEPTYFYPAHTCVWRDCKHVHNKTARLSLICILFFEGLTRHVNVLNRVWKIGRFLSYLRARVWGAGAHLPIPVHGYIEYSRRGFVLGEERHWESCVLARVDGHLNNSAWLLCSVLLVRVLVIISVQSCGVLVISPKILFRDLNYHGFLKCTLFILTNIPILAELTSSRKAVNGMKHCLQFSLELNPRSKFIVRPVKDLLPNCPNTINIYRSKSCIQF